MSGRNVDEFGVGTEEHRGRAPVGSQANSQNLTTPDAGQRRRKGARRLLACLSFPFLYCLKRRHEEESSGSYVGGTMDEMAMENDGNLATGNKANKMDGNEDKKEKMKGKRGSNEKGGGSLTRPRRPRFGLRTSSPKVYPAWNPTPREEAMPRPKPKRCSCDVCQGKPKSPPRRLPMQEMGYRLLQEMNRIDEEKAEVEARNKRLFIVASKIMISSVMLFIISGTLWSLLAEDLMKIMFCAGAAGFAIMKRRTFMPERLPSFSQAMCFLDVWNTVAFLLALKEAFGTSFWSLIFWVVMLINTLMMMAAVTYCMVSPRKRISLRIRITNLTLVILFSHGWRLLFGTKKLFSHRWRPLFEAKNHRKTD